MKILLAASEVFPYSKTGGLADAVGAFAKALARAGHEVGIVTPLHRGVQKRFPEMKRVDWRFDLPLGSKRADAELLLLEPADRLRIYFINQPEYFDRAGLYSENGNDYWDNGERFIFFSKCVAHLARFLPWQPEVLHVNDWHTALTALLVAHQIRTDSWKTSPKVCLTIHNLAYQGVFPRSAFPLTNLPTGLFAPEVAEFYGQLNCLKAGISAADVITTVSPRYAREITTAEFGAGLDGLLRRRQNALVGILNGVDYEEWQTAHNPFLAANYSRADLTGKAACKQALQTELDLTPSATTPLFGVVTRIAEQKGMGIILGALEEMLSTDMQFALLGSGAPNYERSLLELAARFPNQVGIRIGYDQALAHRIEAGSDFYLMPSQFEPCGLNQMYSLRYGAVPIVRRTGGLDDTVVDVVENAEKANGIKFTDYSAHSLAKAIRKALVLFEDIELLARYRRNGMALDFSWNEAVARYVEAYQNPLR
jgi:starch synthase